jgi:hypothetical protein
VAYVSLFRPSAFNLEFVTRSRLCCGQARRQHPERRAGDVVQTNLVAELDRRWFTAVFATDADL